MNPSEFIEILGISAIPATVLAGVVTRQITKIGKKIDKREENREKRDFLMLKGVLAAIGLSKAQAKEIATLGHTNGETESALKYATDIEHEIEDFYLGQGVHNLQ